ncbi:MAG: hypothetical protein Fur0024_3170 [Patescibacteria group bacterium]
MVCLEKSGGEKGKLKLDFNVLKSGREGNKLSEEEMDYLLKLFYYCIENNLFDVLCNYIVSLLRMNGFRI